MQLNELREITAEEFAAWDAAWDRKSKPPEEILNYYVKVILPARVAKTTEIVNIFRNAANENK